MPVSLCCVLNFNCYFYVLRKKLNSKLIVVHSKNLTKKNNLLIFQRFSSLNQKRKDYVFSLNLNGFFF